MLLATFSVGIMLVSPKLIGVSCHVFFEISSKFKACGIERLLDDQTQQRLECRFSRRRVRQGRDTYYDVFPISVTLITSALGRQAFLSFLEKVDGGASSFWMAHDFGMGIEDYQVTITSTIAESTEDGINWTITFTATAEKSPFQDLENQCLINNLPDLYGCYGDELGCLLKAYGTAQSTFPRIWDPMQS